MSSHEHKYKNNSPQETTIGPETTTDLSREDLRALKDQLDEIMRLWGEYGNIFNLRDIRGMYIADNTLRDILEERDAQSDSAPTQNPSAVEGHLVAKLIEALDTAPKFVLDTSTDSESYTEFIEEAKSLTSSEAVETIEIEYLPSNVPAPLDEEDIKPYLQASIPPMALVSVDHIRFVEVLEGRASHSRAEYTIPYDTERPTINVSNKELGRYYQEKLEQLESEGLNYMEAREEANNLTLMSIGHEFGHALHHILPPAALKRWHGVVEENPASVTEYVGKYYEQDHPSKYAEDFAESFAMFIHKPEELRALSSIRFDGMEQIFKDTMPGYEEASSNS